MTKKATLLSCLLDALKAPGIAWTRRKLLLCSSVSAKSVESRLPRLNAHKPQDSRLGSGIDQTATPA